MAVPALRKGQYSVDNISKQGVAAFKRRYTDATTDSYVLVCISGGATFSQIENGTYTDCITGDVKTVTNHSLTATCSGRGNMRVYVLTTDLTPAPGKIGDDGKYLYTSSAASISDPQWDGTQEALTDDPTSPTDPSETYAPCLTSEDEHVAFFTKPDSWGRSINCYVWDKSNGNRQICGSWPGLRAQSLGGGVYRYVFTEAPTSGWMIIWNDGSNQTNDLTYVDHGMYSGNDRSSIKQTSVVSLICDEDNPLPPTAVEDVLTTPSVQKMLIDGQLVIIRDGRAYNAVGQLIR